MYNLKPLQCEFYGLDPYICGSVGIYPGSFNPLHEAHLKIADHIKSLGIKPIFEISISNVDKQVENNIDKRIFSIVDAGFPCVITNAPTFTSKLRALHRFNDHPYLRLEFVVGVDTWNRLFDVKYYNDLSSMKRSLSQLRYTKFNIFPRGGVMPISDHYLYKNAKYYENFIPVDISSTQIRELNGK